MTTISATFEANLDPAGLILPEGLVLLTPHRITATFGYFNNIGWLAGRGYNVFGLYVPARAWQNDRSITGDLNLVLWENMADPIITGREELGISKLFCELPEPIRQENKVTCQASWDGFEFASLSLQGVIKETPQRPQNDATSEGLIHYKYMPKTGSWGDSDCSYFTITPAAAPNNSVLSEKHASGATLRFNPGAWEDLPTLSHIIEKCAHFELGACLSASEIVSRGYKDLSDQREL